MHKSNVYLFIYTLIFRLNYSRISMTKISSKDILFKVKKNEVLLKYYDSNNFKSE